MVEIRPIVLPGEIVEKEKGKRKNRYVYEENGTIYSKVIGIPKITQNEIGVIPLSGVYMPKVGDRVIGIITDVEVSGWFVDINSPYLAFLPLAAAVEEFVDIYRVDISKYFDVGDVILCKISKVTKNKIIQVSMKHLGSRKLTGGIVINVTPTKVPRIIGKGGSMINLLKKGTGCEIIVGQNGRVWIRGRNKSKAVEAILLIEKESHTYGLTEKIEKLLGVKK